ncbi:MAG: NAD(P)-dependent oxidoreductase [Gemmiger sp.]|nr:NAD(P)-dependent oxidoreductase [Gemmiger sp.]
MDTTLQTAKIAVFGVTEAERALFLAAAPPQGVAVRLVAEALCPQNAWMAAGCPCVSVSHKARVSGACLAALARAGVGYLSTRSIGCDHIDLAAAKALGIAVGNVAYSPGSVADFTLLLLLMSLRQVQPMLHRAAAGDYRLPPHPAPELCELTVGVVGTGRIGRAVMARLEGFGCRVLAYSRHQPAGGPSLNTVLAHSDVLTLHLPLCADTYHFLDKARLAQLKPGAILINTGRGELVDTAALADALEGGRLGGAALDVVEDEREYLYTDCRAARPQSPLLARLRALPNLILTPHVAFYTAPALRDTVAQTLQNCRLYCQERKGKNQNEREENKRDAEKREENERDADKREEYKRNKGRNGPQKVAGGGAVRGMLGGA